MKDLKVKEMMVPLDEYATVDETATLYEAVLALEESQQKCLERAYKHRAILVLAKDGQVVGKLNEQDVLKGLEPKYDQILDRTGGLSRHGFTTEFIKSIFQTHGLLQKAMYDVCRKAAELKVKDIMYTPKEGEFVTEETSLDEAIHRLVMCHHQSLLVTRGQRVVGVLRLSDVFQRVCQTIKTCNI